LETYIVGKSLKYGSGEDEDGEEGVAGHH